MPEVDRGEDLCDWDINAEIAGYSRLENFVYRVLEEELMVSPIHEADRTYLAFLYSPHDNTDHFARVKKIGNYYEIQINVSKLRTNKLVSEDFIRALLRHELCHVYNHDLQRTRWRKDLEKRLPPKFRYIFSALGDMYKRSVEEPRANAYAVAFRRTDDRLEIMDMGHALSVRRMD
jgi:hypothetical protein